MDGSAIVKARKDELMRSVPVIVFSAAEVTAEQKKLLAARTDRVVTKAAKCSEDFDSKASGLLKNFVARRMEKQHANAAH